MTTGPQLSTDTRRRHIADVAGALFAARGFRAVGVEDIAAALGVTGPSLYRHFPDKRSILAEVVLAGMASLERATDTAVAAGGEVTETLLRDLTRVAVARPDSAVVWRWAAHELPEATRADVRRRSRELLGRWSALLLAEGRRTDADEAALVCWAALSVLGSPPTHRTRLGAARHAALLLAATHRIAAVDLDRDVPPVLAPAPPGERSRRDELLDAFALLCADRGYHAVSIGELGAAVGIRGPSVYKHFPTKAAVLTGVCRRAAVRLEAAATAVGALADPAERLRALVASYVDVLAAGPDLVVSLSADAEVFTAAERTELLDAQRRYVARWVTALRETGSLDAASAQVLAHAALAVANDFARTPRLVSRPEHRRETITLTWSALGV